MNVLDVIDPLILDLVERLPGIVQTRILGKSLHQDQRTLTELWKLLGKNITLLVSLTPLVESYSQAVLPLLLLCQALNPPRTERKHVRSSPSTLISYLERTEHNYLHNGSAT